MNTYSVWHVVLAICLFPLGLLGFFLPVKKCVGCGHRYGAGRMVTLVVGIMALCVFSLVVLGLVFAVAFPNFNNTKEKAYTASMKSDLRNLVTAQEAYFSEGHSVYAPSTEAMGANYRASSGVTITITRAGNTSWSAIATHTSTAKSCTIAVGLEANVPNEGEPVCK